jgi:hypothetical protein
MMKHPATVKMAVAAVMETLTGSDAPHLGQMVSVTPTGKSQDRQEVVCRFCSRAQLTNPCMTLSMWKVRMD